MLKRIGIKMKKKKEKLENALSYPARLHVFRFLVFDGVVKKTPSRCERFLRDTFR